MSSQGFRDLGLRGDSLTMAERAMGMVTNLNDGTYVEQSESIFPGIEGSKSSNPFLLVYRVGQRYAAVKNERLTPHCAQYTAYSLKSEAVAYGVRRNGAARLTPGGATKYVNVHVRAEEDPRRRRDLSDITAAMLFLCRGARVNEAPSLPSIGPGREEASGEYTATIFRNQSGGAEGHFATVVYGNVIDGMTNYSACMTHNFGDAQAVTGRLQSTIGRDYGHAHDLLRPVDLSVWRPPEAVEKQIARLIAQTILRPA